jgi:hypothetical protein
LRYCLGLLVWLLPVSFCGAFGIPVGIPVPRPTPLTLTVPLVLPGLSAIMNEPDWITTSLADAQTEAPFLDHYDPRVLAPLAEMPRGLHNQYLVLPGAYELFDQSYCLHAGTYAPGAHGNGYLYAPLRGPGASIATDILDNSLDHPEIAQQNIQLLLWALLAHTKFDDLDATLQQTARTLLSGGEINTIRGNFLERLPANERNVIFANVPPAVRQVLEAEDNLRDMFAAHVEDYAQIAGVAVLMGDPPPSKTDRNVPTGRWSYNPRGYFVAYFPVSYPSTLLQISCPGPVTVETDLEGRVSKIMDQLGDSVETEYASGGPTPVPGDAGVRVSAFSAIHLSADGGRKKLDFTNTGYVLSGLPSGRGQPESEAAFAGESARYAWSVQHRKQVEELVAKVCQASGEPASRDVQRGSAARLVDLGNYAQALWEVLAACAKQDETTDILLANPAYEAWQGLVIDLGQGHIPEGPAATPLPTLGRGLVSAPETPAALPAAGTAAAYGGHRKVIGQTGSEGGSGGGSGGGGWGGWGGWGDGGVATPGDTNRQRLAQSGRGAPGERPSGNRNLQTSAPQDDPDNQGIVDRAEKAMGYVCDFSSAAHLVLGGMEELPTWLAEKAEGEAGLGADNMLDGLTSWDLGMARESGQALGGGPPRSDYDQIATPQPVQIAPLPTLAGIPPARIAATNLVMSALADLCSKLAAAQVTRDRLGGAVAARNEEGTYRQGLALVDLKGQSGAALLLLADRLEAWSKTVDKDQTLASLDEATREKVREAQAKLRDQGFSPQQQQAFEKMGLTAAQVEALRQTELAANFADLRETFGDAVDNLIPALREWGKMWTSLPQPPPEG